MFMDHIITKTAAKPIFSLWQNCHNFQDWLLPICRAKVVVKERRKRGLPIWQLFHFDNLVGLILNNGLPLKFFVNYITMQGSIETSLHFKLWYNILSISFLTIAIFPGTKKRRLAIILGALKMVFVGVWSGL